MPGLNWAARPGRHASRPPGAGRQCAGGHALRLARLRRAVPTTAIACRWPHMSDPACVVACALVDADRRVLIAQRPEGKALAGLWEFPGGKLEAGRNARGGADPRTRRRTRHFDQDGVPGTVSFRQSLLRKFSPSDATLRLPKMAGRAGGTGACRPQMGAPAGPARLSHATGRRTADRAALRSALAAGHAGLGASMLTAWIKAFCERRERRHGHRIWADRRADRRGHHRQLHRPRQQPDRALQHRRPPTSSPTRPPIIP